MTSSLKLLNVHFEAWPHFDIMSVEGYEKISQSYEFTLILFHWKKLFIDSFDHLLGYPLAFQVRTQFGGERWFHGVITHICKDSEHILHSDKKTSAFRVVIKPKLHFLQFSQHNNVYNNMTLPEIIMQHCQNEGVEVITKLTGEYPIQQLCIQYNESHYDFIHRLVNEAGLYYYYIHDENSHTLVLADDSTQAPLQANAPVTIYPHAVAQANIHDWCSSSQMVVKSVWLTDYDYQQAEKILDIKKLDDERLNSTSCYQPVRAEFQNQLQGEMLAKQILQAQNCCETIYYGKSNVVLLQPGHRYNVNSHEQIADSEENCYFITEVTHQIFDNSYWFNHHPAAVELPQSYYLNNMKAITADVSYRPEVIFPRRTNSHMESVNIIGPTSAGELNVAEYDQAKLSFKWRKEKHTNSVVPFVRVAQPVVHCGYGDQFMPRVGDEALIHFEDGDANRPCISGMLSNNHNYAPYGNFAYVSCSGIKTHTVGLSGINGYNEFRFDDDKTKGQINIQAQRDYCYHSQDDESSMIGSGQQVMVGKQSIQEYGSTYNQSASQGVVMTGGTSQIDMKPDSLTLLALKVELGSG